MKKILIIILMLIVGIGYFLFHKDVPMVEVSGNLVINNPGLSQNEWYISYEEQGAPGLYKKLIISENINCIGGEESCENLLQKDNVLQGEEVRVRGLNKNHSIVVSVIDFLEEAECNFVFEDFKEDTTVSQFSVDFNTNIEASNFEKKIREVVDNGPNFAGNYALVEIDCGTNCKHATIINLQTGEIITHGLLSSHGFEFEKNSRLLIVNKEELSTEVKTEYYLLQENKLILICENTKIIN